jgi:hypothetical protein
MGCQARSCHGFSSAGRVPGSPERSFGPQADSLWPLEWLLNQAFDLAGITSTA